MATVSKVQKLIPDKDPTPVAVAAIPDKNTRKAVHALLSSSAVELRNAVAHRLYRPTQDEINQMREEVSNVIRLVMTAFGVTPGGGQLVVGPPAG